MARKKKKDIDLDELFEAGYPTTGETSAKKHSEEPEIASESIENTKVGVDTSKDDKPVLTGWRLLEDQVLKLEIAYVDFGRNKPKNLPPKQKQSLEKEIRELYLEHFTNESITRLCKCRSKYQGMLMKLNEKVNKLKKAEKRK